MSATIVTEPAVRTHPIGLVPAVLVCGAAVLLFGFMVPIAGYAMLVAGLVAAWLTDRSGRTSRLLPDLFLIALGQAIISTISLAADISYPSIVKFAVVLGLAVAVPYVISRYWYRERVIRFPWRTGRRWTRTQWLYLIGVIVAGWLIL
ncbi:MAG TPA: CPBP family intramembrane glutamate endopeptidase, partial [Agromyces sp.]|nr:CPBP family intramembrane glutamate endopeptidase [Agromyces sp.]